MARLSLLLGGLALVCLSGLVSGHICMWEPRQRGAIGINNPGDPSCAHKGPDVCGGVPAEQPSIQLTAGSRYFVQFQQNLNHFYDKEPGTLTIDIGVGPSPNDWSPFGQVVPDFNAMDEINLANMTVGGVIPYTNCPHCVIRLTYHSNNPLENDTSTDFHQCADVSIVGGSDVAAPLKTKLVHRRHRATKPKPLSTAYDCCSPPQFETEYNTASLFAPEVGISKLSYDSINKLIYVQLPKTDQVPARASHFVNITSGYEWNMNWVTGVCEPYGTDLWSDWCYGSTQNEAWIGQKTIAGQPVNVYINEHADFAWGATVDTCLPVMRSRDITRETTTYMHTTIGIASQDVFTPAPACHRHPHWRAITYGTPEQIASIVRTLPKSTVAKRVKAIKNKHRN